MRNNQKQRMRGRNRNGNGNKSQNPLSKVYESNGPDVKVRGTANHIADKYLQLARDAQSSGDPVSAENYYQHAEHYLRIVAAAQEQYRQINPNYRPEAQERDDDFDDEDDGPAMQGTAQPGGYEQPSFGLREPQPYLPADQPAFPPREQPMQPQGGHQGRYERRDDRRDDQRRDDQRRDEPRRDDHRRDDNRRDDHRRDDRRSRFERNRSERYGDRNGRDGERNHGQQGGERSSGERYPSDRVPYERAQPERQPPERAQPERQTERAGSREIDPALDALPAFITGGTPVVAAAAPEPVDSEADTGERGALRPRRRRRTTRSDLGGGDTSDSAAGGSDPAGE